MHSAWPEREQSRNPPCGTAGGGGVLEIDGHHAAHRGLASWSIRPQGLPKKRVLRVLADLGAILDQADRVPAEADR